MSENVESGQANREAGNQANSQPSGSGGDKQSSQGEFVSKSDFDKSMKRIESLIGGVQGDKDRLGNRNQKEINEIKSVLEKVGNWDLTPAMKEELSSMKQQTEFDSLRAEIESLKSSTGTALASPASQAPPEYQAYINEAGLDPNDPRVTALLVDPTMSREKFAVSLGALGAATPTPPSPASVVTGSGMGEPPPPSDKSIADEFVNKYTEALRTGKREEANQIKEHYKGLGVPVQHFVLEHKPTY